ncbi:hypothetical protein D3C76_1506030 [compost metagenome]
MHPLAFDVLCTDIVFIREYWDARSLIRPKNPINSYRRLALKMGYGTPHTCKCKSTSIFLTVENKYLIFTGNQITNRWILELRFTLSVPDQSLPIPTIRIVMPCSTRHSDSTEDIIILSMAMITVEPIATLLCLRNFKKLV